mmetsp:Transcript_30910/g.71232  ORF Transcript_30910/g.71232 Transcript_30910/m.71232 type:complete len:237 (-) Transcript_30910:185-895(-)
MCVLEGDQSRAEEPATTREICSFPSDCILLVTMICLYRTRRTFTQHKKVFSCIDRYVFIGNFRTLSTLLDSLLITKKPQKQRSKHQASQRWLHHRIPSIKKRHLEKFVVEHIGRNCTGNEPEQQNNDKEEVCCHQFGHNTADSTAEVSRLCFYGHTPDFPGSVVIGTSGCRGSIRNKFFHIPNLHFQRSGRWLTCILLIDLPFGAPASLLHRWWIVWTTANRKDCSLTSPLCPHSK